MGRRGLRERGKDGEGEEGEPTQASTLKPPTNKSTLLNVMRLKLVLYSTSRLMEKLCNK